MLFYGAHTLPIYKVYKNGNETFQCFHDILGFLKDKKLRLQETFTSLNSPTFLDYGNCFHVSYVNSIEFVIYFFLVKDEENLCS